MLIFLFQSFIYYQLFQKKIFLYLIIFRKFPKSFYSNKGRDKFIKEVNGDKEFFLSPSCILGKVLQTILDNDQNPQILSIRESLYNLFKASYESSILLLCRTNPHLQTICPPNLFTNIKKNVKG